MHSGILRRPCHPTTGKDAAGIAAEAVRHAAKADYDVVLVDTAGRMQDNEPLMRALAKLVALNKPDLCLFVGEALVGNDSVDQVKHARLVFTYIMIAMIARMSDDLGTHPHTHMLSTPASHPAAFPLLQRMMM